MDGKLYIEIVSDVTDGTYPANLAATKALIKRKRELRLKALLASSGVLYKDNYRVHKRNEVSAFLASFHFGKYTGGHLGHDKTYEKCHKGYYWMVMKHQIINYVSDCDKCHRVNLGPIQAAPPLNSLPVPSKVWSLVGINIICPLPMTDNGNMYIVANTDNFSKWSDAEGLHNKRADEVTQFLLNIICRLGPINQ